MNRTNRSRGRSASRSHRPTVEPEPTTPEPVASGPVIHLPERTLEGDADGSEANGDGAAPVRKKTRRGSRGGKNRRKKPAGTALATAEPETEADPEASDQPEPVVASEPVSETAQERAPEPELAPGPSENGDADWGYTPMSQWGLDE